ncbi:hypothetical protein EA462_06000 [Natrarchaeobius halalkaliphilus]|uniref:UDP-glucose/GDP-mannose dehydrogenase N-terminal domain-containing protein n=1 Tax=Natrarchaeobius halalkaliphilus TaxID=1679091 RepID=A0A3N6N0R7_9EURY|nr:hypothetical protein [Natrarchaeobius halalkaliphilus]RQG91512.1 hypothetical protein EA462_06000 [Natrarchaeobius halalkaliphilus]
MPFEANAFIIAVPTDMNGDEPDMSAVRIARRTVAKYVPDRGILCVCSSTVYPDAADEIVRTSFERRSYVVGRFVAIDRHQYGEGRSACCHL